MRNYNVLIDGYNLRLKKGSGIKYYTISLIKALEDDLNIKLLFDFNLNGSDKNKILLKTGFIEKYYNEAYVPKKLIEFRKILKRYEFTFEDQFFQGGTEKYLNNKEIINIPYLYRFMEGLSYKNLTYSLNIKNIDIFHTTYMLNLKVKNSKKITTIHDIIPLKLPHTTLDNKKNFYNKVKKAIKDSDKIITISEYSKKDILETFDVSEEKVVNCYQSYYLPDYLINANLRVDKFKLKKGDYFLFVGNIEPKKNVGRLIQAFLNLDRFCYKKLVIVGRKAWLWEELLKGTKKAIKKKKIILLDYVTREDLIALYKNACAFVFPSLYEGFGLPPLEAMACKCPVITSNITSLPEVCKDAAIYCDPYSVISIQNAMGKILNLSEEERDLLINKGLERVEFFNENDYKNRLLKVYDSVL